jgi:hypothetical protein
MFTKHSLILCDQLQIIMKIYGPEWEDKGSLEHHINRKFMVNLLAPEFYIQILAHPVRKM